MAQVQFGLIVPEYPWHQSRRHRYVEDVDRLLRYVKGHFDSAWFIDHLDGPVLEGWTALTYLAARHPDVRWGHTVLAQSFRNPALLAKMGATLHFLSGGRFILGMGAGGQEAEHLAYGYAFPTGRDRVLALDEALQIIKALWTQERATFEGRYYRISEATCEPKPDPMPTIMVGAFRPDRNFASRLGTPIGGTSPRLASPPIAATLTSSCGRVARLGATRRPCGGYGEEAAIRAPTEAEVADLAAERGQLLGEEFAYQVGEDFVGTPAQIVEQMRPFIELGVDYFLLDCGGFPRLTTVEMLVHEVLPRFINKSHEAH